MIFRALNPIYQTGEHMGRVPFYSHFWRFLYMGNSGRHQNLCLSSVFLAMWRVLDFNTLFVLLLWLVFLRLILCVIEDSNKCPFHPKSKCCLLSYQAHFKDVGLLLNSTYTHDGSIAWRKYRWQKVGTAKVYKIKTVMEKIIWNRNVRSQCVFT